jgi:hypothetical protein
MGIILNNPQRIELTKTVISDKEIMITSDSTCFVHEIYVEPINPTSVMAMYKSVIKGCKERGIKVKSVKR